MVGLAYVAGAALVPNDAEAGGISVDAGLTPAEDRWILRTQIRHMRRRSDPTAMDREMSTYAYPTVLAYGLRPDLTLMARQTVMHRKMSGGGSSSSDTGLADLFVLGKYRLYRRNTREYTFGAAGTLGVELPTGDDDFTSETWDIQPGLFASWRSGRWASDFNISYTWNGFADRGRGGVNPGDELSLDWALAHQEYRRVGSLRFARNQIYPVVVYSGSSSAIACVAGSKGLAARAGHDADCGSKMDVLMLCALEGKWTV
jgi:hypothetical protein